MRTWLFFALVLTATLIAPKDCARAAEAAYDADMVRLHILADGDGAREQLEKLRAREAIRARAAAIVAGAGDATEAYERLRNARGQLERAANLALRVSGSDNTARVELGVYSFPERVYAGQTVPAGLYRAVRVRLGSGEGANWWCVLYPDLCFVNEECAKTAREGGEIVFYSSLARWLRGLFAGREAA